MSWQASEYVRTLTGVTVAEKALLFVLADRHNVDDQGAWPSIKSLAAEVGLSPRRVTANLSKLESKGVIERIARRRADGSNTSNFYRFVGLDGGMTNRHGGVSVASGLEPSIEPEEDRKENREVYEAVFSQVQAASAVRSASQYFRRFQGVLEVNPDSVADAIRYADSLRYPRQRASRPILVPEPGFWKSLAYFGEKISTLDRRVAQESLYEMFTFGDLDPGQDWNRILWGLLPADEFYSIYSRKLAQQ